MNTFTRRKAFSAHLLLSMVVALLAAALVFLVWYPYPYRQLVGGTFLFLLVIFVDVVCGPLLTLLIADPRKSRRELTLDLSVVAMLQLAALLYGLWVVAQSRPVVMAFETDRLVAVTAAEINPSDLSKAPPDLNQLPWFGVQWVGTRSPRTNEELLQSVELSLAGVEPSARPEWWVPYAATIDELRRESRPVDDLMRRDPEAAATLAPLLAGLGRAPEQVRYLPLTSKKNKEWIALIDPSGKVIGYAPVDGFDRELIEWTPSPDRR